MKVLNFTKAALPKLPTPTDRPVYVYDKKTRGLGIRITKSGVHNFVLSRKIEGRSERFTIGRFPVND